MNRVYVIGAGAVCAIGGNLEESLRSLEAGESGLVPAPASLTGTGLPVGLVKESDAVLEAGLGIPSYRLISRTALLGMKAAREAWKSAAPKIRHVGRIGLISGTSVGGMDLSEKYWKGHRDEIRSGRPLGEAALDYLRMHACGEGTAAIAEYLGLGFDFVTTISTACSSAANAIMLGARLIAAGELETAIVGGADALTAFTINGFNSLMIYSGKPCRPFAEERDGLNLGEGAGYLVLSSSSEGALCEVAGWANVNEAFHQTASSPEGDGPYSAMTKALSLAGLDPSRVGYVNTHGTATPGNDASEYAALRRVFGAKLPPFGSVKNLIGHTLGASEGIEACFCAASIAGLTSAWGRPDCILSNAFGFSGNQTSLVFLKCGEPSEAVTVDRKEIEPVPPAGFKRTSRGDYDLVAEVKISEGEEPDYKAIIKNANLRRRMSSLIKRGVAAGLECLSSAGMLDSEGKLKEELGGLITATGFGFLEDTLKFGDSIIDQQEKALNPQPFMQSTFNTIGGQLAQLLGERCYNMTYVHGRSGFGAALADAALLMKEGSGPVLVGWFEEDNAVSDSVLRQLGRKELPHEARFMLLRAK